MKTHRDTLIEIAASDAGLPPAFAKLLIADAPWLDGTEEVNEELGPELLAQEASAFSLSARKVDEFLERYNTLVQTTNNPQAIRQSEAYVAIAKALIPFGKENGFGEGDFWLVEDSFSTRSPVILVYDEFRFPQAAITKLQKILNEYSKVFSEFRVNTEYGAEVLTLRPQ
jgi:hypothetical protein